jgi:hypothetical protein
MRGPGEAERARALLEEVGGHIELEQRAGRWLDEGWTGFDATAPRGRAGMDDAGTPSTARTERPHDPEVRKRTR